MNAACSVQPDCSSRGRPSRHSGPLRRSTTKNVIHDRRGHIAQARGCVPVPRRGSDPQHFVEVGQARAHDPVAQAKVDHTVADRELVRRARVAIDGGDLRFRRCCRDKRREQLTRGRTLGDERIRIDDRRKLRGAAHQDGDLHAECCLDCRGDLLLERGILSLAGSERWRCRSADGCARPCTRATRASRAGRPWRYVCCARR